MGEVREAKRCQQQRWTAKLQGVCSTGLPCCSRGISFMGKAHAPLGAHTSSYVPADKDAGFWLWFLARSGWSVSPPCNPSLFVCSARRHAACGWGLASAGWCKAWHLCTVSANWGAVELLAYICFKIWMELGEMPIASFPAASLDSCHFSVSGRNPLKQTQCCVKCCSISSSG